MYHVALRMEGTWQTVARGFATLDGATDWAQDVLAEGAGVGITGYRVQDEADHIVCSVEVGA